MDIEQIKQLTDLMVENDLTEIMVRDDSTRILIRRSAPGGPVQVVSPPAAGPGAHAPAAQPSLAVAPTTAAEEAGRVIKSPMVGTFYAAADPESPPFVSVGSRVEPDSVVCIIEAMKVFNEIKAEVAGTIEAVLVSNAQPVEYGQPLFRIAAS